MPSPLSLGMRVLTCLSVGLLASTGATAADNFRNIDKYVNAYQQMAAFDGVVLIAEGDDIVWQKAYGKADYRFDIPMSVDTRFRIASLSKQFTQYAIGYLVDSGKIRFSTAIAEFIPDFPSADDMTVQQLIEHRAGVPHTNRLDWMLMTVPMTLDEIIERLAAEPLAFAPGTDRQYSNGGYAVLAKIIELASGMPYDRFIETSVAQGGFPGVGHESAYEVVPMMASRYAPGPKYGERVEAEAYITANRIGGGSLYAPAEDVFRFFRAGIAGRLLGKDSTAALFSLPEDGDTQITGRSPGALAQIYLNANGLTVVTLSSNSAWPAGFNRDIVALYRGEPVELIPFDISAEPPDEKWLGTFTGKFREERFGWNATIQLAPDNLVYSQDAIRTAFVATAAGEFHLPIYDWLCRFEEDGSAFTCRQRDPGADIRFRFLRH